MADDHFPATFSAGFFKRRARLQKSSRARRSLERNSRRVLECSEAGGRRSAANANRRARSASCLSGRQIRARLFLTDAPFEPTYAREPLLKSALRVGVAAICRGVGVNPCRWPKQGQGYTDASEARPRSGRSGAVFFQTAARNRSNQEHERTRAAQREGGDEEQRGREVAAVDKVTDHHGHDD
jgi:hypothetical protein